MSDYQKKNRKKKELDQTTAFDYSLRLLGVRSRSVQELIQRMRQRGYFQQNIDEVVERLKSYGYLNDKNFAMEYARSRQRTGRSIGPKARMELKQKGITQEQIDSALEAAEEEVPQKEVVTSIRERRFKDFVYSEASEKERRRVIGFFLRRGFTSRVVMDVLRADPDDFAGMDDD